jgi:hypothetical protein
MHIDL